MVCSDYLDGVKQSIGHFRYVCGLKFLYVVITILNILKFAVDPTCPFHLAGSF